jgi:hypothetical protein
LNSHYLSDSLGVAAHEALYRLVFNVVARLELELENRCALPSLMPKRAGTKMSVHTRACTCAMLSFYVSVVQNVARQISVLELLPMRERSPRARTKLSRLPIRFRPGAM